MKEYLICIDSDGCAIDSMDIKHKECFGPCMIKEWNLEEWQDEILDRWNEINLYSITRGINRFLGLKKILQEVNERYTAIDGIEEFSEWCRETDVFSNASVKKQSVRHQIFHKVFLWSEAVNKKIEEISPLVKPFDNVKKTIKALSEKADIAIVSSANPKAVEDEWTRFGLMEYITYVMAQDKGTKKDCINTLLSMGYTRNKTLMVGDAPGDRKAALSNSVRFFPIVVRKETDSWNMLSTESNQKFFDGTFDDAYQKELIYLFEEAFK